jgi:hypothetical protein
MRISLADRAGALAQAATVIGMHGGNILSIDVHSMGGASAVDDLVVDFASEPSWDDLRADLFAIASATLIGHLDAHSTDPVVTSLELAASLLTDDLQRLVEACRLLCFASHAWTAGAGDETPQARAAESPAVLVAPVGNSGNYVHLRRPAEFEFTPTEMARVEALIGVYLGL